MGDGLEVSYSVKELLQQLNDRIDAFMTLVGAKADQSAIAHMNERVDQLDNRVSAMGGRVSSLEMDHKAKAEQGSAKRELKRWAVPTLISATTVAVMVWQLFHP